MLLQRDQEIAATDIDRYKSYMELHTSYNVPDNSSRAQYIEPPYDLLLLYNSCLDLMKVAVIKSKIIMFSISPLSRRDNECGV